MTEHPLVEAEAVVVDGAGGVVQFVQGLPAQLRDVVAAEPVEDGRLGGRLLAGQALVGVGGAGHGDLLRGSVGCPPAARVWATVGVSRRCAITRYVKIQRCARRSRR